MKTHILPILLLVSTLVPAEAATSLVVNPVNNRNNFTGIIGYQFNSTNTVPEEISTQKL